jgi:hypothetical protein
LSIDTLQAPERIVPEALQKRAFFRKSYHGSMKDIPKTAHREAIRFVRTSDHNNGANGKVMYFSHHGYAAHSESVDLFVS